MVPVVKPLPHWIQLYSHQLSTVSNIINHLIFI